MNNLIEKSVKVVKGTKWLLVSDGIILVVLLLIIGAFYWQFNSVSSLKQELALSTQSLNSKMSMLEASLATTSKTLAQQLEDQQNKTAEFEDTIDDIAGTVGTLEKLSKTDRELLQKYSRVYFLSENYVPMRLSTIDEHFAEDQTKLLQFHSSARPYLEDMLEEAENDNVDLRVVSAYRSFGTQSALKAGYLTTYGTGSNQFSADQGFSEHQLGTTVDLTVVGQNPDLTIAFEATPAFKWLTDNAYKYGFVLSYPKGNAYYQYEPWHWRFVGKSLATKIHRDGITFADMDQRDIDKYLVKIFD